MTMDRPREFRSVPSNPVELSKMIKKAKEQGMKFVFVAYPGSEDGMHRKSSQSCLPS